MHAIEKILAKNAGVPSVKTGEIVTAKVDFAETYPNFWEHYKMLGGDMDVVVSG